jgi:hypothetical protein
MRFPTPGGAVVSAERLDIRDVMFRDVVMPLLTEAHDRLAAQRRRHGVGSARGAIRRSGALGMLTADVR